MPDPQPRIQFLVPPPKPAPWWMLPMLAALVMSIFAAGLYLSTGDTRNAMLTAVQNFMLLALGYFFGSSAGSAKKDDAALANPKPGG